MKRPSPQHRQRATPKKKNIRGRHEKTWLSPEYLSWCARHRLKPAKVAMCILHTLALENPNGVRVVSSTPADHSDLFDLGEEEA